MSPDPAGLAAVNPQNPQTWNRYAYVGGNPLSAIDPLGLFSNAPALAAAELVEGSIIVEVGSGSGCVQCNKSLTARQDMTGWDKLRHNLATEYLQEKVIVQDTLQNFVDEFKEGGCVRQFGRSSADALNPFSASLASGGGATASVLAVSKYNAAVEYAASQPNYLGGTGLLYPMKSSTVRSMVADANASAASGAFISADLALLQGFVVEMYDLAKGECQ